MATTVAVKCSVHGPMKYRFDADWWICLGYDGELCVAFLCMEELNTMMAGLPTNSIVERGCAWTISREHVLDYHLTATIHPGEASMRIDAEWIE